MYDNASLNEELWHLVNLLTLKAEWEEAGRPGDFSQFQDARAAEIFDELAERIRSLEGDERVQTEQALVDSFNLYFTKFAQGEPGVESLDDIESAFGTKSYFEAKINPYTVVFEFARQLTQLRETDSITETTYAKLARKIQAWLNRALQTLRGVAVSLDSEGGVFDGTAFQAMVLDMERQMRALNERMSRMLAADEDTAGAAVDPFFVDPVVDALIEMGGILSRSAAQKKWTKEKYEANKSEWDDVPKLRNPKHNKIYNPDSTISPDEAAGALVNAGLLPEGSTSSDLWAVVATAAQNAARSRKLMAKPQEVVPEVAAPAQPERQLLAKPREEVPAPDRPLSIHVWSARSRRRCPSERPRAKSWESFRAPDLKAKNSSGAGSARLSIAWLPSTRGRSRKRPCSITCALTARSDSKRST